MIYPPLSVILLSFLQMTWKWCSRDPNQPTVSSHFLPPGPGRGNGTYQSAPTNPHATPLGTALHFVRLSPRQTPTTEFRSTRAHLPITARTKPSSTQEWCLLSSGCEIMEQTSGTSSLVTLSTYLQKTVWPSMVRNLPCSTYVTSVPIHWHFSQYCYPRLFMFSLTLNPRPAYVVITGPRGHSYH